MKRKNCAQQVRLGRCDCCDKPLRRTGDETQYPDRKAENGTGSGRREHYEDILALKTELRSCQVQTSGATKVVTPGIKNPCDELAMLKDSLAQLEKKIMYIKEAISTGRDERD